MAAFRLDNFSGIRPRASGVRLAIHEALSAIDVDLRRGLLRPRARQMVWTSADPSITMGDSVHPQTLYRFHRRSDDTDFWMYFDSDVDIVPGPAESAQQRHYYTGDGEPRMFTADSIDDTTPPYPQPADTKYPYTWFKLGVPAPSSAPVLDVEALPEPTEGSVGLITSVTTSTITLSVNLHQDSTTGLNPRRKGETQAGYYYPNLTPIGGSQTLTCLRPGTRMRVAEVIDSDHVKVVAAGRTGPIEDMGYSEQWEWDGETRREYRNFSRLSSNHKRKSFFLLPDEAILEIENHILRENDIIRITGSAVPMSVTITEKIISNAAASEPNNWGYRTATLEVTDTFEFTGQTSFMIERDGSSIDPVVPPSNNFETEVRAYVYTYVTALGEESAPSPPSEPVIIRAGAPVTITTFEYPPTERRNIDRIWIYRAATGSEDSGFYFVGEISVSNIALGFIDTVADEDLGELLETEGWDPPDENMRGLVAMPNGFLAGFFDNVLCFSEPGFPHAWPTDYRMALEYDIVGIEVYGNALYVTTKGKPYMVIGVHPSQMSARRVETGQPCIDKRSIVNTGREVLYCSPEGLISASTTGFVNVTDKYFTKEQWTELVFRGGSPRSVRGWYYDSQYIMLVSDYEDGLETPVIGLIFDLRDEVMRVTSFSERMQAAYSDPETGELYYVVSPADQPPGAPPNGKRMLLRWDYEHPEAGYSTGYYVTGEIRLPRPMAFSCARVQCRRVPNAAGSIEAHGLVEVTIWGIRYDAWRADTLLDSEDYMLLIDSVRVIDGDPGDGSWTGEQRSAPFRIPVNTLVDAVRFDIHLEGPVEVETIQLGETMDDLKES